MALPMIGRSGPGAIVAMLPECKFCGAPMERRVRGGKRTYCNDQCRNAYERSLKNMPEVTRVPWKADLLSVLIVCRDCGVPGPKARLAEHVLFEHKADPDVLFRELEIDAPLMPNYRELVYGAGKWA